DESQRSIVESLDANAALVHGAMVKAAEREEIGRFGFPAVGPMLDVMGVDVASVSTAGKAATFVARIPETSKRGGDSSRLAAHVERLAIIVFNQVDDACVAGEPARSFRGHGRAMLEL